MSDVDVERHIATDLVRAALLLTSHDVLTLFPGLEVGELRGDGPQPAVLTVGRRREEIVVEALPPRRTPTAFVAGFRVRSDDPRPTEGAVTLFPAPGGTLARLHLAGPREDLEAPARRFLGELARRAEGLAA